VGNRGTPAELQETVRSIALSFVQDKEGKYSKDDRGRVLAITSVVAGEGKSTLVYQLGIALAEFGQRILLVDANFTHPQLHQLFGLPNVHGLSTTMVGESVWSNLICTPGFSSAKKPATDLEQNADLSPGNALTTGVLTYLENGKSAPPIDILTSGPPLDNPSPWIISEKMTQMIKEWRNTYDYILLDTPSLTQGTNAYSLIPKVNAVILVVHLGHTLRDTFRDVIEKLPRRENDFIAIVINS